jgi:cytochrome P450
VTETALYPPGPARSWKTLVIYGPGRDPLKFFSGLAHTYGDISHVHMAGEHLVPAQSSAARGDVLVTNQRNFLKGRGLERARRLLGDGLLTSEGATHLRQRRLMQPTFHRDRIASYATVMTDYADRVRRGWQNGAVVDIAEEMNRLTLRIVGKTLFDADVGGGQKRRRSADRGDGIVLDDDAAVFRPARKSAAAGIQRSRRPRHSIASSTG